MNDDVIDIEVFDRTPQERTPGRGGNDKAHGQKDFGQATHLVDDLGASKA